MNRLEFESFFKTNFSRFFFYAQQYIKEEEACRDIVSDSFFKVLPLYSDLNESQLTSYLFSIIRNRCIDYVRHQSARQKYSEAFLAAGIVKDDGIDRIKEEEEMIDLIYNKIDELPEKTRNILEMCFFKNKTYRETGEKIGLSTSGVRKHIIKAIMFFREELKKKGHQW